MKIQRKQGRQKKAGPPGDQVLAMKSFHYLKLVHKEIKKAKQFEIRKIVRRIKEAAKDGTGKDAAAMDKLQVQLAAARATDVDALTSRIAQAYGLQQQGQQQGREGGPSSPPAPPSAAAAAAAGGGERAAAGEAAEAVNGRILGARCVRDQAAAAWKELQQLAAKLEGAAKKAAEVAQGEEGGQEEGPAGGAAGGEQGAVGKKKGKKEPALDAVAEGALAKLLAERGQRAQQGMAGGGGGGSDSEADSGVVRSDDLVGSDSQADSEMVVGRDVEEMVGSDDGSGEEEMARGLAGGNGSEQEDSEFDSVLLDGVGVGGSGGEEVSRGEGSDSDGEGTSPLAAAAGTGRQPHARRQQEQQRQEQGNRQKGQQAEGEGKRAKKVAQPPKPKNRLGQRARRKLAAQMFGRQARHLQQQQQQERLVPREQAAKPKQKAGSEAVEVDAAALHPSWAAKRQQKLQITIGGAAPAAKKIKFDEDGGGATALAAAFKGGSSAAGRSPEPSGVRSGGKAAPAPQQQQKPATLQGALHPSWEAKKAAAAQQKAMLKPAGTKITFDDD